MLNCEIKTNYAGNINRKKGYGGSHKKETEIKLNWQISI